MRESIFSNELADRICAELSDGKSLRTVCKQEGMPSKSTVFRWLRENKQFAEAYSRAKEEASDAWVEEILDIADDGTNDWMEVHDKEGKSAWKVNGEHIQRSRVRIDTRKWVASKMKPKKYGDKLEQNVTHGVDDSLSQLLREIDGKSRTLPR